MWPDRVSNPGPLTYESGALSIALRGPAALYGMKRCLFTYQMDFASNSKSINCIFKHNTKGRDI